MQSVINNNDKICKMKDSLKPDPKPKPKRHRSENLNDDEPATGEPGAREDAMALHNALQETWGANSEVVIDLVAGRSIQRRLEIAEQYFEVYRKELDSVLRKKLRNKLFRRAVRVAMMPLPEFYAQELRSAVSGTFFNDNEALVEILCTIDHVTMRAVNQVYWKRYKTSLQFDLKRNTSGYFQRLLVLLSLNRRAQHQGVDREMACEDARQLLDAGEGKLGTDETTFNHVLTTRSWPQLLLLFQEYETLTKHSIETAIRREFTGKLERALLSLVRVVRDKPGFVAQQLHSAMVGLGTKNKSLVRLVVTQAHTDHWPLVKTAFRDTYGVSLADFVQDDTSGNFRKFILAMIGDCEPQMEEVLTS